jgi:hypothetical protein
MKFRFLTSDPEGRISCINSTRLHTSLQAGPLENRNYKAVLKISTKRPKETMENAIQPLVTTDCR